jgi:DNA-binding PadR family transcriptional regulator
MYRGTMQQQSRDPAFLILTSLAAGPRHGYAIVEDVEAFAGVRLGPGTLYGALARLEAAGLIAALAADDRRRPYELTVAGAAALGQELEALDRVTAAARSRLPVPEG